MKLHSWGQYPVVNATLHNPDSEHVLKALLEREPTCIARGMGRSYGDSALANDVIMTTMLSHFLCFDNDKGLLKCQSGTTLADIIDTFLARGWALPVVPGTQYVTVGGAIASDIHGKNHHQVGSFSQHVMEFRLLTASGEIKTCSKKENSDYFHATCGGMGLTGIIIDATIQLQKLSSTTLQTTTIKTQNLEETLHLFEQHTSATYSVAWLDCLTQGKHMGRALLMLGEHSSEREMIIRESSGLSIPFNLPSFTLNRYAISLFNALYYGKQWQHTKFSRMDYHQYFFPLDKLQHWNRLYGSPGLVQYQFVIPRTAGIEGLTTLLDKITTSKKGSFLSVLKLLGKSNDNLLSFPMEGYTLALDFKVTPDLFAFLEELDAMVVDFGGRIYLTKDARMSATILERSYPKLQDFLDFRESTGANKKFHSTQSERLKL